MENILLFSLIVGLASALLLIPFSKSKKHGAKEKDQSQKATPGTIPFSKKKKNKALKVKPIKTSDLVIFFVLLTALIFSFYYITNLDRNLTSLWVYAIFVTGAGALLASGIERKIKAFLFLGSIIIGAYFLIAFLFNANEKYETAHMKEKTEIEMFDEKETPASVPPQFARNKMKKAFGQVPNTSYYELGNLQIQKVDGEYVYIAPVEFSGFFKWWKGSATPGYFTISATDSSDNPKFIKADMGYTPSSYFNKNVERYIRLQYPKLIFYGDVQLEVNDEGKPYYIRSYGKFISARDGFKVEGIVMTDPKTGDTKAYELADVPKFIDGAISPEVVSLQNSYFGNYVHGYLNSKFGKSDVKLPSDEGTEANVSPIFDENGIMYYFTDFTSPKEGVDSMLGYSLTNSRTGAATYYTGNSEESYMDSQGALQIIEKKFIEKKWQGEMPVLYNFYGEASWLTPVLDSNGFLQNYFIVSAANPEISVYGSTPNAALKQYKTALQRGGSSVDRSSKAEEKQTTGTILRVYKEKSGDFTITYFLLDNQKNFTISSENEPLAIYLQAGDIVKITYMDTEEQFLPAKKVTIEGLK